MFVFMRPSQAWSARLVRTVALAAAAAFTMTAAISAQGVVPLDAYSRLPNIQSVAISPDGERIAMITGAERNEMYVVITPLGGEGQPFALPGFAEDITEQLLAGVSWLSDDFVQIIYRTRLRPPGGTLNDADIGRRVIYNLHDQTYAELGLNADIVSLLPDDPDRILVAARVAGGGSATSVSASRGRASDATQVLNLYEYTLSQDRYRRIAQGSPETVRWVLGADHQPAARQDFDFRNRRYRIFSYDSGRPRLILEERFTTETFGRSGRRALSRVGSISGVDWAGRGLWFAQLVDRDLNRAHLLDPQSGDIQFNVIAPEGFDFSGFTRDWRTNEIIGGYWDEERRHTEWFDPAFGGVQAELDAIFEASDVQITDWDLSGDRMIVRVEGGDTTVDYYLFNRESNQLEFISTAYPEIPQERIHPVQTVDYQARDGLDLWGYLTLPNDREASNLPLVLLPHGGPQARDYYGYESGSGFWTQPLADMGYAVFQPQFRGSDGMGFGFVRRGHGEWGRLMQSDLSDAIEHLANEGVIDPDRVCIYGWSYGGYAALAGYALTPELYRCAIAGAPVSDILAMMRYSHERGGQSTVNYWSEYIGDWRLQRNRMIDISPAQQVRDAQAPLMLIHPREDLTVPIEQSEIMERAARDAGQPVEMVAIDGDGHNLLFRRTRLITIEAITRFLMEHNPPDPR